MKLRCYHFMLSGWGLGHATRVHALIEEVRRQDALAKISVYTWGPAHSYFASFQDLSLHAVLPYLGDHESLYGANLWIWFGRASKWSTLWFRNLRKIRGLLRDAIQQNPTRDHILVSDSDFHQPATWLLPFTKFAISQTPFVLERWKQHLAVERSFVWATRLFLWETLELFWQRANSSALICPRLDGRSFKAGPVVSVSPIVRNSFLLPLATQPRSKLFAFLGSGSLAVRELSRRVDIAQSAIANLNEMPNVAFGISQSGLPAIDACAGVISQCGYSTLSEILSRDVPALLAPVDSSPEQLANARYVVAVDSRCRILDPFSDFDTQVRAWVEALESRGDSRRHVKASTGAQESIEFILSWKKQRRERNHK